MVIEDGYIQQLLIRLLQSLGLCIMDLNLFPL